MIKHSTVSPRASRANNTTYTTLILLRGTVKHCLRETMLCVAHQMVHAQLQGELDRFPPGYVVDARYMCRSGNVFVNLLLDD